MLIGSVRYNGTIDEVGAFHIGPVLPGKYVLNIVKTDYRVSPSNRGYLQIASDRYLTVEMDPSPFPSQRFKIMPARRIRLGRSAQRCSTIVILYA